MFLAHLKQNVHSPAYIATLDININITRNVFNNAAARKLLTVDNVESVVSRWQTMFKYSCVIDATVKFAKVWKCSCAHPDNEILILISIVLSVSWVELVDWLLPVRWMCRAIKC